VIVKQTVSIATVSFDDLAVANFFEQQVDLGRKPEQFARVWVHTHPGNSASPSMTDAETFHRVFGSCNWSVMSIVAQGGNTFALLHFGVGPAGTLKFRSRLTTAFNLPLLTLRLGKTNTNIMSKKTGSSFLRKPSL
jgi:hypothetical protein